MTREVEDTQPAPTPDSDDDDTVLVTAVLDVRVPREGWIDWLTTSGDIFSRSHCGYWLRGVEWENPDEEAEVREHAGRGWLCWEDDEQHRPGDEPNREAAMAAWRAGKALPEGWYQLDQTLVTRAYVEGVKRWGVDWFHGDHGDANGYDVVLQLAMLGEVRYG